MFEVLGNDSFSLGYSFNKNVDFCVWVLENTGLQVPPFDRHSGTNGQTSSSGLDGPAWQNWLSRVVTTLDNRLCWSETISPVDVVADTQQLSALFTQASGRNISISENNLESARQGLERSNNWHQQQYQEALVAFNSLSLNIAPTEALLVKPPDVWNGKAAVGELLKGLWQVYLPTAYQRDAIGNLAMPSEREETEESTQNKVSQLLYECLVPFKEHLPTVEVYRVAYPFPVKYATLPNGIILSDAIFQFNREALCQSVENAARDLVNARNS